MSITRGAVVRKALHNMVDYTTNYFSNEIRIDKFGKILNDIIREIDIPELRTFHGIFGGSSTTFDITNPLSTTFRYTWVGGKDPNFSTNNLAVSDSIYIEVGDFDDNNEGTFTVTDVTDDYFEVTNASGVVESGKKLKKGIIILNDLRGIKDIDDYPMPSDFQKFGGIIVNGDREYKPLYEEVSGKESIYSRYSVWIEDNRFFFSPGPIENQSIIIPYYKDHPVIASDSQVLILPNEAEDCLVQGVRYEFMEMDIGRGDNSAQLQLQKYEESKTKFKTYLLNIRLKGRRQILNDLPDTTFNI